MLRINKVLDYELDTTNVLRYKVQQISIFYVRKLASPQASFRVCSSRIHESEMTNPKGRPRRGYTETFLRQT